MSFNRSGYIGRAPGDSAITIARKTYEPTGVQTDFTFTAGYDPGYCDVYLNGSRLISGNDYTASNGSTVGLTSAAQNGDIIEVVAYKAFNLGVPLSNITGDLSITGSVSASSSITADNGVYGTFYGSGSGLTGVASTDYIITGTAATFNSQVKVLNLNVTGVSTVSTALHVGTALTANAAGDVETIGIITATKFAGNATGLTGTPNISAGTGAFSGAVNVDDTTDSTSATSGALIVDGGLGVAKNVYIGAGLSVAGTLTYEDVTNVDSVGLITAKSGVNVTGGQIQVGAAFSVGPAGVVTATSYYGDGSNLSNITSTTINSNADNRLITGSGTANTLNGETNLTFDGGEFKVGSGITMAATAGVVTAYKFVGNGKLTLRHDGANNGYIEMDTGANGNLYIKGTGDANIQISNNYTALGPGQKLLVQAGGVDIQNGYFKAGVSTVTSLTVTGTSGLTASGGEFKVGTALTVASTSGVATFSGTADVHLLDSVQLNVGDGSDLKIYHNGSHSYVDNATGSLFVKTDNQIYFQDTGGNRYADFVDGGAVKLYYSNAAENKKFETTNDGVVVTGIMTASAGVNYDGLLSEKFNTTAGKLSDNTNIDLEDGMVHYFSTQETTTSTPNIRYSSSKTLNNMLSIGDAITVTIITTAASGGYSANMTIDGGAQTEEWVGGSAPSAGAGSDGLDILTFNILKTASATFKVIGNHINATN